MEHKIVALLGFDVKMQVLFCPLFREAFGVADLEVFASFSDMENSSLRNQIDTVIINSFYVGFEIERKLKRVRKSLPEARMVCFSPHCMTMYMCIRYVKSGIDILLSNIPTHAEYQKMLFAIKNGRRYYPGKVREGLDGDEYREPCRFLKLSPKEKESLELTMCGYSLKQIAAQMSIKEGTVGTMRKNTMRKLGVHGLPQLINATIRFNIIKSEEDIVI